MRLTCLTAVALILVYTVTNVSGWGAGPLKPRPIVVRAAKGSVDAIFARYPPRRFEVDEIETIDQKLQAIRGYQYRIFHDGWAEVCIKSDDNRFLIIVQCLEANGGSVFWQSRVVTLEISADEYREAQEKMAKCATENLRPYNIIIDDEDTVLIAIAEPTGKIRLFVWPTEGAEEAHDFANYLGRLPNNSLVAAYDLFQRTSNPPGDGDGDEKLPPKSSRLPSLDHAIRSVNVDKFHEPMANAPPPPVPAPVPNPPPLPGPVPNPAPVRGRIPALPEGIPAFEQGELFDRWVDRLRDELKGDMWKGIVVHKESVEIFHESKDGYFIYTADVNGTYFKEQIRDLGKYLDRERQRYASNRYRLFNIDANDDGYVMSIQASGPFLPIKIQVSKEDFDALCAGNQPRSERLFADLDRLNGMQLMLFSNPFRPSKNEEIDFAFGIQKAFPSIHVYRDPPSDQTAERVEGLQTLKINRLEEINIIIGTPNNNQDSAKTIRNISGDLTAIGLAPIEFGPDSNWDKAQRGRAVIVITGHSAKALEDFVILLGSADVFRDNFVVFNSCQEELTERMIATITGKYGAAALLAYQGKISTARVQDLMLDIPESLITKKWPTFEGMLKHLIKKNKMNAVWIFSRIDLLPPPRRIQWCEPLLAV